MKKSLMIMAALVFILSACLPGQTTTDQTQAQINTAVAAAVATQQQLVGQSVALTLTSVSQNTLPTAAGPTAEFTPTNTPLSFPTLTPVVPLFTPVPAHVSSGVGVVPVKRAYACSSLTFKPAYNSEFHKGDKFDIKWIILNTGTQSWPAGIDLKYSGGTHMTSASVVEIPLVMKPNDSYQIVLDATAPTKSGSYSMTWMVQGQLCYASVTIMVK